ncbi:MAG: hypothetical protein JSW05_06100 [Candidatus Thorarchaeota archaeon]|nr:MAG: hypothetical protein JSW05_06100 [Candidatus Thorarchaeota archaeon]
MAVLQLLLFILFAMGFATMFSGFMAARRMGFLLMPQVMLLMLGMLVSLIALIVGLFLPTFSLGFMDLVQLLLLVDFVFFALAFVMEFIQVVPVLMKTMQGGPIHSSHITNLIVSVFLSLAMVLYYVDLAAL